MKKLQQQLLCSEFWNEIRVHDTRKERREKGNGYPLSLFKCLRHFVKEEK